MICVSGVARLGKVVSPGNLEFGNPGIAGKTGIYNTEYDTQYTTLLSEDTITPDPTSSNVPRSCRCCGCYCCNADAMQIHPAA